MNILSTTFNILQSKGYTGSTDLFEIIHWLESKNIYLDLTSCWDGDRGGVQEAGFLVRVCDYVL